MASTTRTESNRELVLRFNEAVNSGDLEAFDEVLSEEITDHTPLGTTHGIERSASSTDTSCPPSLTTP